MYNYFNIFIIYNINYNTCVLIKIIILNAFFCCSQFVMSRVNELYCTETNRSDIKPLYSKEDFINILEYLCISVIYV